MGIGERGRPGAPVSIGALDVDFVAAGQGFEAPARAGAESPVALVGPWVFPLVLPVLAAL